MEIIHTVEKYFKGIVSDEFHRYKSWDICHGTFNTPKQTDKHALMLAFYLASWGMYRGSSGFQKNYLVHQGAVDILFSKEGKRLRCHSSNEVNKSDINDIISLKDKLAGHYASFSYSKGTDDEKFISPTDTLLSKVMLGSLGCVPAYDRYFIDGLKELDKRHTTTFNKNSLEDLFDFIELNYVQIKEAQNLILNYTKQHYPVMKILDMHFWQIGYEKELMNRKKSPGVHFPK